MNQELNRFFNRIQNHNFSFTTDKFDEEYLIKLEKELQKEINKNLLERPDPTCNWLKSTYNQIVEGQEYIHKTYIVNIQNRINDKSTKTIISKEEDENFQGANIILNALDLFKDLIIQNIKLVKPEMIKSKNTKVENIAVTNNLEEAAEKHQAIQKKYNAKYLKENGERFSYAQIALFMIYKKINNNVHDPRSITSGTSFHLLVTDFGFDVVNSANQLYRHWSKRKENDTQKLGHKQPMKVKKDIEEILDLLEPDQKIEAEKDIKYLENKISDY